MYWNCLLRWKSVKPKVARMMKFHPIWSHCCLVKFYALSMKSTSVKKRRFIFSWKTEIPDRTVVFIQCHFYSLFKYKGLFTRPISLSNFVIRCDYKICVLWEFFKQRICIETGLRDRSQYTQRESKHALDKGILTEGEESVRLTSCTNSYRSAASNTEIITVLF